jgi:hypothetical protein
MPIKGVPLFILYVDGIPHANYKGNRNLRDFMDFLNKIVPTLSIKKNFVQNQPQQNPVSNYNQPIVQPRIQQMNPLPSEQRSSQQQQQVESTPSNGGKSAPYNTPWRK